MKKIFNIFIIMAACMLAVSCNDEWKDELYENYVSFNAPLNDLGVTNIYVRYQPGGVATYQMPLIVSGTNASSQEINAKIALDPDTLAQLNIERFQNRKEFYYTQMSDNLFTIDNYTVNIPKGSRKGLLPITFNFKDIDMYYKWILPLTIVESDGCKPHPRKNYKKALLRVYPFTDYSGSYQSTNMSVYFRGSNKNALVVNTRQAYVVDENTVFFYAGTINEDDVNRYVYKIFVTFNEDGTLTVKASDDRINFKLNEAPTYTVDSNMDAVLPYLKYTYVKMNLNYSFDDVTSVPGTAIGYDVRGNMTMVRRTNITIPDEDQAIQWE